MIELAGERYTKNLCSDRPPGQRPELVNVRDEAGQADYIVEQVLDNREAGNLAQAAGGAVPRLIHSGPLEVELTRRNIPFVKFGGLKFLDAAHVKDVLACCALREPARPRGRIPRAAAHAWHRPDRGEARARPYRGSRRCRHGAARACRRRRASARTGAALSDDARLRSGHAAGRPRSSARGWYEPHLERSHDDAEMRRADLVQLEQIAAGYPSRERFLTEITLDPPDATSDRPGCRSWTRTI